MKYVVITLIMLWFIIIWWLYLLEKWSNHKYIISYKWCTEGVCGVGHIELTSNHLFDLWEFNKLTNNTKAITNIYKVY